MAENRGQVFEDQFKASVPRGCSVLKLHTPAPPASQMLSIVGMVQRLARQAGEELPGWVAPVLTRSSHTAAQPYDMLILAPAAGCSPGTCTALRDPSGAPLTMTAQPKLAFALELKSVGSGTSLPFDRVREHQELGLERAYRNGDVAGVVVEWPSEGMDGEVYFVPIVVWQAHRDTAGRKSLSLEACRRIGQLIKVDVTRGRKHRYWKVGDWLRTWGAEIQE